MTVKDTRTLKFTTALLGWCDRAKKRLTASAARRKHSVTVAIFDCCTLICRIGEKLAVYPSQMPRVLKNITQRRKIVVALCAVNAVIDSNETDVFLWENHFTDMDKTTKPCKAADDN